MVAVQVGCVGGVVAYHDVAVGHGSPLAYEGVVRAHRASRLAIWCARTCWATYRVWIVQGDARGGRWSSQARAGRASHWT